MQLCGAPTLAGHPCRLSLDECNFASHVRWRERQKHQHGSPAVPTERTAPAAVADRDIPAMGWWAVEGLTSGTLDVREAGVLASLLRVLIAAGESGASSEEALAEVELRGLLMHGIPARDREEWERMEAVFTPEAVAEARRWRSLKGDARDRVEPGFFRDQ